MQIVDVVLGALIGACLGSYLTCVTWRIPQRMRITGRSVCAVCETPLKNRDNIPILGWLMLRGRSSCCKQRISVRYPLIETAALLVGVATGYWLGQAAVFALAAAIIVVTATISFATSPPGSQPDSGARSKH